MAERERVRGERGNRACWAGTRGIGRREKGKGEEAGRSGSGPSGVGGKEGDGPRGKKRRIGPWERIRAGLVWAAGLVSLFFFFLLFYFPFFFKLTQTM